MGIVGARNCSPSGAETATALAHGLARAGVTVVSGAARGIDAAAHRGALEAGGRTIAVLGSGVDVAYPQQNRGLIERIAREGLVISEYPPGVRAEPFRFPARNRLVAALSRGVVIVEGARGSGSMLTAEHALDLGREVFAMPGSVASELSAVPLALIREGAIMIRGWDDLMCDLGLNVPAGPGPSAGPGGGMPGPPPDGAERAVWDALASSMLPDTLAARTRLPVPAVISALVGLELRGLVRTVGGRYERRTRPPPA